MNDIVLCGHSYGGMVLTGVADQMPERIAALVYLDAFLPARRVSPCGQPAPSSFASTHATAIGSIACAPPTR
jgi:pimeloyl-ACP methyl ester carboxylesterase